MPFLLGGAAGAFGSRSARHSAQPSRERAPPERRGLGRRDAVDDTVDLRRSCARISLSFRDESCGQCRSLPRRHPLPRTKSCCARLAAGRPLNEEVELLKELGQ